jgi:hypothetical protein
MIDRICEYRVRRIVDYLAQETKITKELTTFQTNVFYSYRNIVMLAKRMQKRGARHVENTSAIRKTYETLVILGKLGQQFLTFCCPCILQYIWQSLIPTVTNHEHQYGLTITEAVLIQFCLS